MEIGEFIEQDILIFLDDRTENQEIPSRPGTQPIIYLTRDYEKELLNSLNHNDIPTAKRILHDLKEQFEICPAGTMDKARIKELLLKLYDIFKGHLDAQHIPLSATVMAPQPQAPAEPAKPDAALAVLLSQIEDRLGAGDLREAITTYQDAKRAMAQDEPVETRLRLLTLYGRIKQAIVDAKQESAAEPAAPAAEEQDLDGQLLLQIEQQKRGMEALLAKNDIQSAMQEYRKMLMMAQQLHDKEKARDTVAKLERIYSILETLRKHSDEQMLGAVP